MKLYKNYIDGKWLESESKELIQVDDPATGKIIGEISCAKKNEVDLAVSSAKAAFNSRILHRMQRVVQYQYRYMVPQIEEEAQLASAYLLP